MTTSKSPPDCKRVKIFRLALLRALTSNAQTPMRPTGVTDLVLSLVLGLPALLVTLLPLVCLC